MKNYYKFLKENVEEINEFISFEQLNVDNYIRIWRDGKELGNFKVREMMNTDPMIPGVDNMMVQKMDEFGGFDETDGLFKITKSEFQYQFKKLDESYSAGIVFIYNNKMLLVHDVNLNWEKTCSYPKGHLEEGETNPQAAIREVAEEIGVGYPLEKVKEKEFKTCGVFKNSKFKTYYYTVIYLDSQEFKNYFSVLTIPKENLQAEEVDWAGFVGKEKAEEMLAPQFYMLSNLLR